MYINSSHNFFDITCIYWYFWRIDKTSYNSILIGSSIATKKLKKNGLLNGAIIGILYILIIYLISSILNSNFAINLVSLIMIGIGLVGGVLGRYNWSKYKVV